jgi:hypothetical protein
MPVQNEHDGETKTTEKARQAAQGVGTIATSAMETGKETVSEAATQLKSVAAEAKDQVGRMSRQAADEFRQQADERSAQVSQGLRSLSSQLDALANGRVREAGSLVRYLQDGQSRITTLAERLEQRGAQGVLDDLGAFARRRPGLFLLCAAGAGLAVGRMVRANAAGAPSAPYDAGTASYGKYDRAAVYAGGVAPTTSPMVGRGADATEPAPLDSVSSSVGEAGGLG